MKKRTKILSVLMAGTIAGTVAVSGCTLVSADPQADMNQVIAEVDVTVSDELDTVASSYLGSDVDLSDYTDAITSTNIYKRDLVALFLGSASTLLSDGSTTYGEAFETLAETLVDNEILIQYTTMATLADMVADGEYSSAEKAVEYFNSLETDARRYEWILEYQAKQYEKYNGESINYVNIVTYTLYSSINSTIDDYEEDYLDIDDDDDESSATLPTNVDTEVDNYYPTDNSGNLYYGIYTGYEGYLIENSKAYSEDKLEGSTRYTRMKAYNDFIQLLDSNYLITDEDDIRDVLSLDYVESQYVNLLCEQMINNYFELYEDKLESDSLKSGDWSWVQSKYEAYLKEQTANYSSDYTLLETAMASMSSESFILYAPSAGFGYVYNILLPFSQSQSDELEALSSQLDSGNITKDEYYYKRNQLLKNVTTTDQRSSWFNGGVDYSFDASNSELSYYSGDGSSRNILFFENNLTNSDRYEALENYYGMYTYNGIAVQNDDDSYTLIPDELGIDDMMDEVANYINFVAEQIGLTSSGTNALTWNAYQKENNVESYDVFYSNTSFTNKTSGNHYGDVDYEKFIYAYGKVNFTGFSASDLMNTGSNSYKIMSAVNELQYAYTTDTGVLSEYVGYSVSAYDTDYVKEFEYACQLAISGDDYGVGTFMVVATDYGWHIIYVTYVLKTDTIYGEEPDWKNNISKEGTFENLFYEMLRSSALESRSSIYQNSLLLALYTEDETVTLYESRYSDLTSLSTTLSS